MILYECDEYTVEFEEVYNGVILDTRTVSISTFIEIKSGSTNVVFTTQLYSPSFYGRQIKSYSSTYAEIPERLREDLEQLQSDTESEVVEDIRDYIHECFDIIEEEVSYASSGLEWFSDTFVQAELFMDSSKSIRWQLRVSSDTMPQKVYEHYHLESACKEAANDGAIPRGEASAISETLIENLSFL